MYLLKKSTARIFNPTPSISAIINNIIPVEQFFKCYPLFTYRLVTIIAVSQLKTYNIPITQVIIVDTNK